MEHTNSSPEGKTKNITLRSVLAWILGIIFLIAGIALVFTDFLTGLVFIVSAALTLPVAHKFLKEKSGISLSASLRSIIIVILFIIAISVSSGKKEDVSAVQPEATTPVVEQTVATTTPNKPVVNNPTPTQNTTASNPKPVTTPAPATTQAAPAPQSDRASVLVILKANASAKWGDNYQMVKYEYDNQVQAYDWVVAQTKYPSIMAGAKQKWSNNYQMVKYEYENQVEAYEWVQAQTAYPDIMAKAKQKWGTNYQMVKYEYENQVEAYKSI
jgi:cell division septation protein DedD